MNISPVSFGLTLPPRQNDEPNVTYHTALNNGKLVYLAPDGYSVDISSAIKNDLRQHYYKKYGADFFETPYPHEEKKQTFEFKFDV